MRYQQKFWNLSIVSSSLDILAHYPSLLIGKILQEYQWDVLSLKRVSIIPKFWGTIESLFHGFDKQYILMNQSFDLLSISSFFF